jgi:hypothetical protein
MGSPATAPLNEPALQADKPEVAPENQPVPLLRQDPELLKWQNRLLPVMAGFVIALALAFFVLSMRTLHNVDQFVQSEHGELQEQIKAAIDAKPADSSDDVIRRGLLILEADALDRRYHQASALLMSRIWGKNLAFMVGMIMAFLGAIFILGKLSESPTAVKGGDSKWSISITSASPGILLAFFGTVLVALSIIIHENIDVKDGTAYLSSVTLQNEAQGSQGNASSGTVDHSITDKIKALREQTPPTSVNRK